MLIEELRRARSLPQPLHVVLPIRPVGNQHLLRQNDAEGGPTRRPKLYPPPRRSAQPGYGEGFGGGEFLGSHAPHGSAGASPSHLRLSATVLWRLCCGERHTECACYYFYVKRYLPGKATGAMG